MLRKINIKLLTAILFFSVTITGCQFVSPTMLETPSQKLTSDALPLTVGVDKIKKKGTKRLTNISTYQSLGIMGMHARMPRRTETDYLNKSISNALRAGNVFEYVYATPFDKDDINLILETEIKSFKIENTNYGTIMGAVNMIPYVNIVTMILQLSSAIPQEEFNGGWEISFHLKNKDGKILKTYTDKIQFADSVNLYQQPFAGYMWYESEWLKEFKRMVKDLSSKIKKDKNEILSTLRD